MVATISPTDDQYHHTVNTLKYADRAKEIKTHIHKNIGTIDTHVADYQRMIDNLQVEVCRLKKELADKESQLSKRPAEKTADDELSWLNILSHETSENVQERINLQKALFELEETNIRNRIELQHLDDNITKQQVIENNGPVVQALISRRQVILDNIRDNDELGTAYKKEIEVNEKQRHQLQNMIEGAVRSNGNRTYLNVLSQYRLLGMGNTELQFEIAMRDQIIQNQKVAHKNLWCMLIGLGLDQKQLMELAARQGITIEDWATSSDGINQLPLCHDRYPSAVSCHEHHYNFSACLHHHHQDFSSMAVLKNNYNVHTVHRQEHHSSYYTLSHEHHHPSPCSGRRMDCSDGNPLPGSTSEKLVQDAASLIMRSRKQSSQWNDIGHRSYNSDFGRL